MSSAQVEALSPSEDHHVQGRAEGQSCEEDPKFCVNQNKAVSSRKCVASLPKQM